MVNGEIAGRTIVSAEAAFKVGHVVFLDFADGGDTEIIVKGERDDGSRLVSVKNTAITGRERTITSFYGGWTVGEVGNGQSPSDIVIEERYDLLVSRFGLGCSALMQPVGRVAGVRVELDQTLDE
jgi:hypothetical protein